MPAHHHAKRVFRNPPGSPASPAGGIDFLKFLRSRITSSNAEIVIPEGHALTREAAAAGWDETAGDKLQWLGHSAFRWRLGDTVLLSDPLLTDRASPFPWAGPQRFVPSPLQPEEAEVDLVLLTHNHYDHLDLRTLARLPNKKKIHFLAPLGLAPLLRKAGLDAAQITQLDWHETALHRDLRVTLVPAVHFSARTPFDRNRTLWGGYVLRHENLNIYLSGDTAAHPTLFRDEIGMRHGPFDYGLVPIGAYEPRRIMVEYHATPEEGVRIGAAVKAHTLVGHHWGALRLTTEPPFEPRSRFQNAARGAGFLDDEVWLLKVGETRRLTKTQA